MRIAPSLVSKTLRPMLNGREDGGKLLRFLEHHAHANRNFGRMYISSASDVPEVLNNLDTLRKVGTHRKMGRTLFIWCEKDVAVPLPANPEMLLPNAQHETLKTVGHAPHLTHPHLLNPVVLDFLDRWRDREQEYVK